MNDPESMRISNADREAAAKRLHDALGEGRITVGELEERLDAVYAARTAAELRPPLADLPGGLPPSVAAIVPPPAPSERVQLRTGAGSVKRTGNWQVPAGLLLTTAMGSIHLDFSEVRNLPSRIDVEIATGIGEIVLVLPADGSADVHGVRGTWGEVSTKVPGAPSGGTGTHVVIHGKVGMGSLSVRGPRKRFWKSVLG